MSIGHSKVIVQIWAAWWSAKAFVEELIYDASTSSAAARNKKCLVIILCETRAQEITFNKFKKNLLDVLDADLALCVEKPNKNKMDRFYKEARYVWTYDKPKDWVEALDYAFSQEKGIGGVEGTLEHQRDPVWRNSWCRSKPILCRAATFFQVVSPEKSY